MRTFRVFSSLLAGVILSAVLGAQYGAGTAAPSGAAGSGPGVADARPGGQSGRRVQVRQGEECPPGTTEVRPHSCQAPGLPAPSIVDYRPRSTLVTAAHPVSRAKFPVVDFHGHPQARLNSPESLASLVASLDALNIRLMVSADNMSGDRLQHTLEMIRGTLQRDRVRMLAGIDFRNVGPGWSEKAVRQLEADVRAGAVGVGEISKSLGLSIKKADGTRLTIDDSALDPVWDACARLNLPVFIHTADPQEFFEPINYHNERWLELSLFPDRHYPSEQYPRFEQLMAERDDLFKKHPKTTFIAAHMGWHANDLARLGRLFDALPNLYTEVGAILYDLGRQPRTAHDFFIKYQDRILFGKDAFQPEEYPYFWRVFETEDESFESHIANGAALPAQPGDARTAELAPNPRYDFGSMAPPATPETLQGWSRAPSPSTVKEKTDAPVSRVAQG